MRASVRAVQLSVGALLAGVLLIACGGPKTPLKNDGGSTGRPCLTDSECDPGELCFSNICRSNDCSNEPCPEGYTCNSLSLQCVSAGNPDGGTDGGGNEQPNSCSSRCDCTGDGQICQGGRCKAASSDGSCVRDDQCPLGTICDISRKCVPGCAADCDCSDSKICNSTTLQCEACSRTNPCPEGFSCTQAGECAPSSGCTNTSECTGGQVCKNNACGFCSGDADCAPYGTGYTCGGNGLCQMGQQCSDSACQTALGTPRAYCDTQSGSCATYECLTNSDCVAPATCNVGTKTCSGSSTCTADCNGQDCLSVGLVCEPVSCTCTSQTGGNQCGPQNAGLAVKPDCTTCDIAACLGGGCVDAADTTRACTPDFFSCFLGALFQITACN